MKKKNFETKKCPNCGYENVIGAKKCIKCGNVMEKTKSCPKCAKINGFDAVECTSCGFTFNKKRLSLVSNLIISILVVLILCLLVYFDIDIIANNMSLIVKAIAIICIMGLLITTLTYGSKDKMTFSAEEKINNREFSKVKKTSYIIIVIALVAGIIFSLYYYLFR